MTENIKTTETLIESDKEDNGKRLQNEKATADCAEAEHSENAAAEIGNFKSADALLKAYLNLEAEFTRRSQRLKELEQANKAHKMPTDGAPSPISEEDRGEFVKAALSDESVKRAVVEEYLKAVAQNKGIPLIVGGVSAPTPKAAPKSVSEAGRLAERFLKN